MCHISNPLKIAGRQLRPAVKQHLRSNRSKQLLHDRHTAFRNRAWRHIQLRPLLHCSVRRHLQHYCPPFRHHIPGSVNLQYGAELRLHELMAGLLRLRRTRLQRSRIYRWHVWAEPRLCRVQRHELWIVLLDCWPVWKRLHLLRRLELHIWGMYGIE
jgi:hypothetical protein